MILRFLIGLIFFCPTTFAAENIGQKLYDTRCAMCHGPDARATGPLAQKSNPPTPDLTTCAYQQRLAKYPGAIISSIVLRPNKALISTTLKSNGIKLAPLEWTEDDLRAINQYILVLISKQPKCKHIV